MNKLSSISALAISANPSVDVSVIIVNWNTCELLRQCLRSLRTDNPSISSEVIVVDNNSSDDSVEMVRREFEYVYLIPNQTNRGFAAANNQGIAVANGRYVLLLNSDTIVLDRAIERTIAFAEKHLDTAVVGCRVLNPDRTLQNSCFMFPSILNWVLFSSYLYRLFPDNRFFGRELMTWWARDDAREVDVVTGCYMLVRKEALDQVGAMDERFFMYAEETDWCYRFKAKGWKNRFTPDAEIIHIGGASAVKLGSQRAQVTNRSFVRYMFKHWSKPRAAIGVCMLALFYFSRLAVLAPKRLITRQVSDRSLLENHWVGLKDILAFRRHLTL
jgi:GT2 family glycosyltransferase